MAYEKNTWASGDVVTSAKLNHMENGIEAASSPYDAVIRLTHSNDSSGDSTSNLTPSIVSGTFSHLYAMLDDTKVPNIRVEYYHPWGMFATLTPYVSYFSDVAILIYITGYLPVDKEFQVIEFPLSWFSNDNIVWDD